MGKARKSNRKGTSTTKKNRCLRLNGQPKRIHATKAEADNAAEEQVGRALRPYFCKRCGGYHLSSRSAGRKIRKKQKEDHESFNTGWSESMNILSQDFQTDRPELDGRFDDLTLADKLNKWANGNAD